MLGSSVGLSDYVAPLETKINMKKYDQTALDELVIKVRKNLEKMGIMIVDETNYTLEGFSEGKLIVVLIGYYPEKAAIFNVSIGNSGGIGFTITGQIKNEVLEITLDRLDRLIPDVGEKYKIPEISGRDASIITSQNDTFSISANIFSTAETGTQVLAGMDIFRDFAKKIGDNLEIRFTQNPPFYAAPVMSDKFQEIKDRKGTLAAYEYFRRIVTAKFPEGYYPKKT